MASPLTNVGFTPTAGGTTDWTYSSANPGYQSPVAGNVVNGGTYEVFAKDASNNWEISRGVCTISVGIPTFARTTVLYNSAGTGTQSPGQSGAGTKINFGTVPSVSAVLIAEDLVFIQPPQGRLTLVTGTPVMTTTQTAITSIFWTPYVGNQCPIYDGVSFRNVALPELTVATTDTTKSPAAIGASKVNDWFIWDDAGTFRVGHGPDWTNDTTRSAGTALVMVNGILLNNAAITNGPAASRGTYVGTTRSDASSKFDYIPSSTGSGGGNGCFLGVWNCYNRILEGATTIDNGASYTYTPASATIRQARASAGNQISFVTGLAEDSALVSYASRIDLLAVNGANASVGFGFDATNAYSLQNYIAFNQLAAAGIFSPSLAGVWNHPLGFHTLSANEKGDGANVPTFNGNSTANLNLVIRM